jgi:hypothetical protein
MSTKPDTQIPLPREFALSRRRFLHGLGVCVALPAFQSLLPLRAVAGSSSIALAATADGAPLRAAFLYFPNGAIPSAWWPKAGGANFEFSRTLEPLAELKEHIQVLGGLDQQNAAPGPDGAGDHARASGTFLTGVRVKKTATDIHAGISIDQVLAQRLGHLTRLPSLELTCDAGHNSGACDSGYSCAYQYNLSWSSPTAPMTPEANPRLVFERLFGSGAPGQRAESLRRRRQEQRSILDYVLADAHDMQLRLNGKDRDKLDQYLTGVREIEGRIQRAERLGDAKDPNIEAPAGIPATYTEQIEIMFDLLTLAFQTDSTRIATLLLAHDGSNRSFSEIGIPEGHHDLSHHFDDPEKIQKVSDIDLWYVRQFAKWLRRLKSTPDVDGRSLLHNSMIVYGGGNADGNRHTHVNLPIILAGAGGGTLTPGRYFQHGSMPMSSLFLAMAERMGIRNLDKFGDSDGRLGNV